VISKMRRPVAGVCAKSVDGSANARPADAAPAARRKARRCTALIIAARPAAAQRLDLAAPMLRRQAPLPGRLARPGRATGLRPLRGVLQQRDEPRAGSLAVLALRAMLTAVDRKSTRLNSSH